MYQSTEKLVNKEKFIAEEVTGGQNGGGGGGGGDTEGRILR